MTKKIVVLMLALLLCVALSGCEGGLPIDIKQEDNKTAVNSTVSTTTTTEADTQQTTTAKKSIDVAALRAVEQADTFALSIVSAKGVENIVDNGPIVDLNGEDGVVLTLKNKTNAKIQKFTILILCTDANGEGRDLGTLQSISGNTTVIGGKVVSYSNHVKVMGTETADLEAGTEEEYTVQCNLDDIVNVNAIVYSYVDSAGKEVVNPNYEKWLEKTSEITVH